MIQILHSIKDYFSLTKPRVVVLLQITAICSVIIHDSMQGDFGSNSIQTMLVVLIGGYLTAGGANAINMWYDRDIDPKMAEPPEEPFHLVGLRRGPLYSSGFLFPF